MERKSEAVTELQAEGGQFIREAEFLGFRPNFRDRIVGNAGLDQPMALSSHSRHFL